MYTQGSSFGQIAQRSEIVHRKREVLGSNPTRANSLYEIEKPELKMNIMYVCSNMNTDDTFLDQVWLKTMSKQN